jgi:hypothetical protein
MKFPGSTALLFPLLVMALAVESFAAAAKNPGKTPAPVNTVSSRTSKPVLDSAVIRKYYLDGEFDPAIGILETD